MTCVAVSPSGQVFGVGDAGGGVRRWSDAAAVEKDSAGSVRLSGAFAHLHSQEDPVAAAMWADARVHLLHERYAPVRPPWGGIPCMSAGNAAVAGVARRSRRVLGHLVTLF